MFNERQAPSDERQKDPLFILLLIVPILFSGCAFTKPVAITHTIPVPAEKGIARAQDIIIEKPKLRFEVGESYTYHLRWVGIPVGEVASTIKGIEKVNGRDCYHIELIARTNKFASKIYRIDDVFISYMDAERFVSQKHMVKRREGRYKKDAITVFDQENHKALFENLLDKSKKVFDIPPDARDPLAAIYYFRTLDLKVGDEVHYKIVNNENVYDLYASIRDKCFIKIGKSAAFEAFYIEPAAYLNGELVKKGVASGYMSADSARIPLYGIVRAPLFTRITASLWGHPVWGHPTII